MEIRPKTGVWNDAEAGLIYRVAKGENPLNVLSERLKEGSNESETILHEISARLEKKLK